MSRPKLSPVGTQLLTQLLYLRRCTMDFTGAMMDKRLKIVNRHGNPMLPETVHRRLRELNSRFAVFECINPYRSQYTFTKTPLEIINLMKYHDGHNG